MCNSTTSGSAVGTQLIVNDRVRVTEWRFKKKGDNTGWHRHDVDYMVVPLFTGVLKAKLSDTEVVSANVVNGVPYYRDAGVEHDVLSDNDFECAFIEVEFLQ